jgi:hypothetical protein
VLGGRGYGALGHRQINTNRKVLFQVNFLDDDILHCLLCVLSFYADEYFITQEKAELERMMGRLVHVLEKEDQYSTLR